MTCVDKRRRYVRRRLFFGRIVLGEVSISGAVLAEGEEIYT